MPLPAFVYVETRRFVSIEVAATEKWMTTRLLRAVGAAAEVIDWKENGSARAAIEEDIAKARKLRSRVCAQDLHRGYHSAEQYRVALGSLASEQFLKFDTKVHDLRGAFLRCLSLDERQSLEYLHVLQTTDAGKRREREGKLGMLCGLLDPVKRREFHEAFDSFVRVCVLPIVARLYDSGPIKMTSVYYQSFPCVRLVRPGEFSIGCHSDITYGFSQATINVWVPLTICGGTNSLMVESSPGLEDWHDLRGGYGDLWMFWGAMCNHFTPANTTATTRVSLDCRVVPGPLWEAQHDRFSSEPGYFSESVMTRDGVWQRVDEGDLPEPDYRVGFPFT